MEKAHPKQRFRPAFIRHWRTHRGLSLDQLAARIPMDKGNLSKLERGILPYNQELIELIAVAVQTDVVSLLTRDPAEPTPIWTSWDKAQPNTRRQIEEVAAALVRTGTNG